MLASALRLLCTFVMLTSEFKAALGPINDHERWVWPVATDLGYLGGRRFAQHEFARHVSGVVPGAHT
jgi:hypothetical protein